jgi:hypothetical protein
MERYSRLTKGHRLGLALTSGVVALLFAPHLVEHLSAKFMRRLPLPRLSGSIAPRMSEDRSAVSFDSNDLFARLEEADQQWHPQEELLPDGSTRFLYKRRVGEPDLSIAELRSLINDPPTFHTERQAILSLLDTLRQVGVRVMLTPTIKKGAAAEWEHLEGVMRIQPDVTRKGSLDFLRVLNHEAIHVAQSCRGGSLLSKPQPLGVPVSKDTTISSTLRNPVYVDVSPDEKRLELEAYSLQNDINKANTLVRQECKLAPSA